MTAAQRLARLDAVRALGVLLVIAYHASYRFAPTPGDWPASILRVTGWMGVDLFFALSGFLIGRILMNERARGDLAGFFRKRAFRIVPIYLVAIAVFVLADLMLAGGGQVRDIWKTLLFLTGYLAPFQPEARVPYTITWSLSVEVTAYALLAVVARYAWPRFKTILFAMVLLAMALRFTLVFGAGWGEAAIELFPPARLDAIALGALAALGTFDRWLRFSRAALVYGLLTVAIVVAFRYLTWFPPFIFTLGYTGFGLVAALWVAALARGETPPGPVMRAAASIGLVSYFMYLFHLFFLEGIALVADQLKATPGFWTAFAIGAGLTFVAARASWRWFEEPLIRHGGQRERRPVSLVP